jgi:hypothetical protein
MPHVDVIRRARLQPRHRVSTLSRPVEPFLMFGVDIAEARIAIKVAETSPAGALAKEVI